MIENRWLKNEQKKLIFEIIKNKKNKKQDTLIMIKYLFFIAFFSFISFYTFIEEQKTEEYLVEASWQCQRCKRYCWKENRPYTCNSCGCHIGEKI